VKVLVRQTEDGYVVASNLAWAPGTYPTPEAAARAAWNMRNHGTPEGLITPVANNDHRESA